MQQYIRILKSEAPQKRTGRQVGLENPMGPKSFIGLGKLHTGKAVRVSKKKGSL